MKILLIDGLGLAYDGNTLNKRGIGGSEAAVILLSKELVKIGFEVTVLNSCIDIDCSPGRYDDVLYIDHSQSSLVKNKKFDVVVLSRSVHPLLSTHRYVNLVMGIPHRVLWMHDTFAHGDEFIEGALLDGFLHEVYTLSDFHTNYVSNNRHGNPRMFEVIKDKFWQTRNGAVRWIDEVDVRKKDKNLFVYNSSATKGLIPLVTKVWPRIKEQLPNAKLTCVGGFYKFRDSAAPDEQEKTVRDLMKDDNLKKLDVNFTGIVTQKEVAEILAKSYMMIYPPEFPETSGISTIESLLYRTPLVTSNFGALEETALDLACYKTNYPIKPNVLFPHINEETQIEAFVQTFIKAYNDPYLHQQKQYACDQIRDIVGWDTVALQWKQHLYNVMKKPLSVEEYRKVTRINEDVTRVFGRRILNKETTKLYRSFGSQRRIVIISPFRNAGDYLHKCIESVQQQDYDNYLHVLIDDGSDDPIEINEKNTVVITNTERKGCIRNQIEAIEQYTKEDDIVILLDGDDWLVNNNTIFHLYNDIYSRGYEFTYGSCWSQADNIPHIAQDYSTETKLNKSYRKELFNWNIPYSHLRTFLGSVFHNDKINYDALKDKDGNWMMSGGDTPFFYELIEKIDPSKIYVVKDIIYNYNDENPLNDYKVNNEEQTRNARSALT